MKREIKIECYLEEYSDQQGRLCARLRDKKSDRVVVLSGNVNKSHLLRFMSQAKNHQNVIPTIFDKNGMDIIAVRGYILSETDTEVNVCVDTPHGGYLFE